jgi:hypothetical protein
VDWNAAWKSEALKRFLAMFVAMLAGGAGPASPHEAAAALPRHLYRAVLAMLRPAEKAAWRLIFVAADHPTDAPRLRLRASALLRALDDLPAQVRRFANWQAHHDRDAEEKAGRVRRLWALRMGRPPSPRHTYEVRQLLSDVHGLGFRALDSPDTS